jgi:hypothetical protein
MRRDGSKDDRREASHLSWRYDDEVFFVEKARDAGRQRLVLLAWPGKLKCQPPRTESPQGVFPISSRAKYVYSSAIRYASWSWFDAPPWPPSMFSQ